RRATEAARIRRIRSLQRSYRVRQWSRRRARAAGERRRSRTRKPWSCAWSARSRQASDKLRNDRARELDEQPDADKLQAVEQSADTRHQAKHDQAEAKAVHFGQRMEARKRVGEAQQSDRASQEEEGADGNRYDRENVESESHSRSFASSGALKD